MPRQGKCTRKPTSEPQAPASISGLGLEDRCGVCLKPCCKAGPKRKQLRPQLKRSAATGGICQQRYLATAAVCAGQLTVGQETLDPSHDHSTPQGIGRGAGAAAGGTCEQCRHLHHRCQARPQLAPLPPSGQRVAGPLECNAQHTGRLPALGE